MACKTFLFWLLPSSTTSSPTTPPLVHLTLVLLHPHFTPLPGSFPVTSFYVLSTYSSFQGSTQVSHSLWILFAPPRAAMSHISRISLTLHAKGCHSQKSFTWPLEQCSRAVPCAVLSELDHSPTMNTVWEYLFPPSDIKVTSLNVRAMSLLIFEFLMPNTVPLILEALRKSLLNNWVNRR